MRRQLAIAIAKVDELTAKRKGIVSGPEQGLAARLQPVNRALEEAQAKRREIEQSLADLEPISSGREAVDRIVKTIAVFDDFCHANDPYEEHDFGSFDADGRTILFKIDYYDRSLSQHSPDASDPSLTERVITIMLADEY